MKKRKSKKLIISLSVIFIILLLLIITLTMWPFKSYKIIETKTFSEIPGFIFEYPIFEGWEVSQTKKINDNEYYIFFKCLFETVVAPSIKITKTGATHIDPKANNFKINKNNVKYYSQIDQKLDGMPYINFYENSYTITIYPYLHEGDGYSGKIITEKIILATNIPKRLTKSLAKKPNNPT